MGVMAGLCEVDEETARRVLKRAGEECCKVFLEVYGYDLSGQDLDSLIRLLGSSPSSDYYRVDEDTIIYEFNLNGVNVHLLKWVLLVCLLGFAQHASPIGFHTCLAQ